jgi:hypothetical protein
MVQDCVDAAAARTERHTWARGAVTGGGGAGCEVLLSVRTISRRLAASAATSTAFEEGTDDEDEMCMFNSLVPLGDEATLTIVGAALTNARIKA